MSVSNVKTGQNILLIIFFLLLIAPFIVPINVIKSPYIQGPNLWFIFLCGIIAFYFSLYFLKLRNGRLNVNFNIIDVIIIAKLFYIIIQSILITKKIHLSQDIEIYSCLIFIYLIFKFQFKNLKENAGNTAIKCFLLIITVICLCLITSSLWQLFHNPSSILKISGSFYNPARNANYLISLIPFLLCGVISPKVLKLSKRFCIIMLITAVLSGFILILAYTRAAWIGLLFSLYFILLIHYRISILKRKGLFLIIIIIGMCVGGISIYKLKPQSALGRITIWKISLQMIKDNPVIGVGYGNFHKKYNLYQGNYFGTGKFTKDEVERADTVRYAYNEILHSISELGIFGLFLNCCLVYLILKTYVETFKSNNNTLCFLSNAVLASFIAITVSGFFSYPFDILPVKIVCFLYLGLYSTTIEEKKSLAISNTLPYFISAILTIYGGYLTVDAILKYNAYKDYKNANNANSMEAIYPILIEDTDFIEKYSDLLLREYNYKAVILLLRDRNDLIYPSMLVNLGIAYEASSDYIKAEYCYIKAVNMIPNRFYSKYILATFYLQNGQIEKGMKISTEILTTKPKIPSKSVEKIKSEIKRLIETQSINKNK